MGTCIVIPPIHHTLKCRIQKVLIFILYRSYVADMELADSPRSQLHFDTKYVPN